MGLAEEIISALRDRNASGDTFEHMANISGVSRAYIHQIANHRSDPLKMSLEKFLALFPYAKIELVAPVAPELVLGEPDRRAHDLEIERRELDAERRELDAIRRELDAEHRVLELERELRPPQPPWMRYKDEPAAPYRVSGAKSISFSDKEVQK